MSVKAPMVRWSGWYGGAAVCEYAATCRRRATRHRHQRPSRPAELSRACPPDRTSKIAGIRGLIDTVAQAPDPRLRTMASDVVPLIDFEDLFTS